MRNAKLTNLPFYLLMVVPGMVLFIAVVVVPIFWSIGLGFTNYDIYNPAQTRFVGLDHYARLFFGDPALSQEFWRSFQNNLFTIAVAVFGEIPLGFFLAYILYRNRVRHTGFFQAMIFLPNFISTVVIGILWAKLISPIGPLTALVRWVTGDPQGLITWQLDPSTAMLPVAFAYLWIYTGFYMVVFLANMQRIDSQILEAAQIDGAGEVMLFRRIIVPILAGVVLLNVILGIAGSLKGFDLIFAMTSDGISRENTEVLPIFLYKYAFRIQSNDAFSFGSAISTVIVSLSVVLILLTRLFERKSKTSGGETE